MSNETDRLRSRSAISVILDVPMRDSRHVRCSRAGLLIALRKMIPRGLAPEPLGMEQRDLKLLAKSTRTTAF